MDKGGKKRRLFHVLQNSSSKPAKKDSEPQNRKAAMNTSEAPSWIKAMQEEYDSLIKNDTWEIVNKLLNQHTLTGKWVFKRKIGADGKVARHKAWFVV